ncbi:hypothetical protein D0Z00_003462 [Geotrichum galactomycetum]|uniref:Uncharacterized protein n=1 Tax=Geotrichum galactomycetum TaxID=27317 RepID=A0ACB6V186_9ASCO|nr:hypothetical protein D0Z00_003462 [Geotrichum candidum]
MKDSSPSAPQQQPLSSSPSVASSSAASAVPTDLPKPVKSKHPSTIELTSALGIPTKARSRRVWTREEDEKLRRLVAHWGDQRGKNSHWDQISAQFEGRTNKDCRKRWFHSLDPTLKRGRWTEDEDRILLEAYGKMGSVWNKIAQLIPGRTDDQCSKRYNDVLDPSVRDRLHISEKLIALILGFKSGHDNEATENGTAVDSRTNQHADDGRVVDVTSVVVLPEFRKSSVGTTLFKDYIQRLATVGVADRIRVRVPADTGVAEFFERLEFEKRGGKTQDGFLVLENTIEEDDDDSIEHDQEDY